MVGLWLEEGWTLGPWTSALCWGEYMAWMGFPALPLNPALALGKTRKPSAPHATNVNMGNQNLILLGPFFGL